MIIHLPHASTFIPSEYLPLFQVSKTDLEKELLLMTDHFTDELFKYSGNDGRSVNVPVSRLLVDVERFLDDSLESMAKQGMGAVYTNTADGRCLKSFTGEQKEQLLERYYHPHHQLLNELTTEELEKNGFALFVDCHSFPSDHRKYLGVKTEEYPEICIGTDPYHTCPDLAEMVTKYFTDKGYKVALNTPYAGTLVPGDYWQKNPQVQSVMIEIRRDLYMNEATGEKTAQFTQLQEVLSELLRLLSTVNSFSTLR